MSIWKIHLDEGHLRHIEACESMRKEKRRFNLKKTTRKIDLIATIAGAIEEYLPVPVQSLCKAINTSAGTIFNIIHDDLGLVKKSARWVPKLLSPDQMEKRVETLAAFVQLVQEKG
jgi:hypothetical protein